MGLKPPTRPCWGGVFLFSAILLFPGPSSIWSWDLQSKFGLEDPGGVCVPMGRGWWWWWLSFLLIFTIDYIIDYSSAGVSISTSIIKYWSYWLLLASFWLLFLSLPWFGFVSAWWEVSEWWTYHDFRHVAICVLSDWLPIIIWALRHCSRIFSRAGESSECARPNPQWELLGVLSWRGGEKGPLHLRLQLIIMVYRWWTHGNQTVVVGKTSVVQQFWQWNISFRASS